MVQWMNLQWNEKFINPTGVEIQQYIEILIIAIFSATMPTAIYCYTLLMLLAKIFI